MIVLDTSAAVEFFVGTDPVAERVRAVVADEHLAAPHAIDLECASTLRGLVLVDKLSADAAQAALDLLAAMTLRRYAHGPLLTRIWQLRHNMWPYDAAYVALAETLGVALITVDRKFAGVPGLRCDVRNLRGDAGEPMA